MALNASEPNFSMANRLFVSLFPGPSSPLFYHVATIACGTFLISCFGCDRNPMIRVYEVPREADTTQLENTNPSESSGVVASQQGLPSGLPKGMPGGMAATPSSGPRRFLIAVVPNLESVIFVKGSGKPELLVGLTESLGVLAKSIRFDGPSEIPTWTVPEGWKEAASSDGIAMAKFTATPIGAESALIDFTLSQLPKPLDSSEWPAYFEQNVNRWRGQLGLPPSPLADSMEMITELPRDGMELPAYLVDIRSAEKEAEPAIQNLKVPLTMAPPDASTPKTESKLKYAMPEGWNDDGARGMRAASFSFEGNQNSDSESAKGEVTVIFAGGDRLANVVRWQGQLAPNLSPEEQKTVAENAITQAMEVKAAGGQVGQLYTLRSSQEPTGSTMLAAIIPMDNGVSSVFVKLTSPTWLADEHQSRLVQFIESLSW